MPRLSNPAYLYIRDYLRHVWLTHQQTFSTLDPAGQQVLHDFFRPSRDLTDAELFAHRKAITEQRPSLPQRAGRALAKFDPHVAGVGVHSHAPRPKNVRNKNTHLTVQSLIKPALHSSGCSARRRCGRW